MSFMIKKISDSVITLLMWTYFTVGFVVLISPFYIGAFFFSKDRETAFQYLNSLFLKGFFFILQKVTPGLTIDIDRRIQSLTSAVVVCNHRSYLDPILLISLFKKHKTIVKSVFFHVPIFGWVLKTAGYIPSSADNHLASLMIHQVETIHDFLASGGILFIFPEGTRNQTTTISPFGKGAFTIAVRCGVPIKILFIRNTDNLFQPGKFLFNTCIQNTITVELTASFNDGDHQVGSISDLMKEVRLVLENRMASEKIPPVNRGAE